MNVPFVTSQYNDLKVFCVVYLQANRDFQNIITQLGKIFFMSFLHLVHLNGIFQNKLIRLLDPPYPQPLWPKHTLKGHVTQRLHNVLNNVQRSNALSYSTQVEKLIKIKVDKN